jgi:transcriptional regulator with XRE-family HTH domain
MNRSHIGERIETLRIHKGFSSQTLAKRIGKSQATVSRIENGKQGVSIEMLERIAKALNTSPYHLLSDLPPRHSTMLPPIGALRSDGPIRMLASTLERGRQRSHLTREAAARELALSPDELEAFELGYAIPDADTRRRMATLYSLDAKVLEELAYLEEHCPLASERMASAEQMLLSLSRMIRGAHGGEESPELRRLIEDVQKLTQVGPEALSAEREASYFSIGHLSDALLQALQDPAFHEIVERLAAEYTENRNATLARVRQETEARSSSTPL